MNILILGIGEVGFNIAKRLMAPDNHITIVDRDEGKLNAISDLLDIRPVYGHASYPEVLEQAGAAEADILIAATNSDEVNVVACEVCHSLFDIGVKIARIKNQNYLLDKYKTTLFQPQNLSVDHIISPELEIAKYIERSLQVSGTLLALDLAEGIKLLGVRCLEAAPLSNAPLSLFKGICPQLAMAVVAIQRDEKTNVPLSKDIVLANDVVYFILEEKHVSLAMEAFGYPAREQKNIIVAGAGPVGLTLAQEIEALQPNARLVVIEKDRLRSEAASRGLTRTAVIHGDTLDEEILQEAGISSCDAFIATTRDDHVNVLSALLAKHHGAQRAVSLLEVMRNTTFYTHLGIDALVNQNAVTVSSVLKAIRQHRLRSLYSIDNNVEILEAFVNESSQIVGMNVQELIIPGQVFIAVLNRNKQSYIRPKQMNIMANDHLIFVATQSAGAKLEKLVSGRTFYR